MRNQKRLRMYTAAAIMICSALPMSTNQAFSQTSEALAADPTTPPGITIVDVTKLVGQNASQYLWRRLGDQNGKPLYTYDADSAGASQCYDACAVEFTPFLVERNGAAKGDWSIVKRTDGSRQWAYQGKPLYRFSGEDPVGRPVGPSPQLQAPEKPEWRDPASKVYSPKEGWRRALFDPTLTARAPSGIAVRSLAAGNGYGFVSQHNQLPMYVFRSQPREAAAWEPVYAPSAARPIGEFTIVRREDGTPQWAYKNKLLYTFTEDYAATDINGLAADKGASLALAYKHFLPKGLRIAVVPNRGPLLVNADGLSIYTQTRTRLQYGGRQTRDGYRIPYTDAKAIGVNSCVDQCAKEWLPVRAPVDARGEGFWEVADRPDGTKQWVYKGSLLYTYTGDKKLGDIEGNNRYDIMFDDPENRMGSSVAGSEDAGGDSSAGMALYWHVTALFF